MTEIIGRWLNTNESWGYQSKYGLDEATHSLREQFPEFIPFHDNWGAQRALQLRFKRVREGIAKRRRKSQTRAQTPDTEDQYDSLDEDQLSQTDRESGDEESQDERERENPVEADMGVDTTVDRDEDSEIDWDGDWGEDTSQDDVEAENEGEHEDDITDECADDAADEDQVDQLIGYEESSDSANQPHDEPVNGLKSQFGNKTRGERRYGNDIKGPTSEGHSPTPGHNPDTSYCHSPARASRPFTDDNPDRIQLLASVTGEQSSRIRLEVEVSDIVKTLEVHKRQEAKKEQRRRERKRRRLNKETFRRRQAL